MGEVKEIKSSAEFNDAIKVGKLVVVDFYADWCGPCKMIGPKVAAMATEFTDVVFCKVNVDEQDEVAQDQNISAMPTFKFYKNGEVVGEVVGASEAKIREAIESKK